jgi:hypothetical protein
MIIIGLLIGGVLKGQELIANAQITATAAAVKGIDAAATTFRDTYAAMPGDITNPVQTLPNCAAAPCSNAGNGDSRVNTNSPDALPAGENIAFWVHLSAADLISGVNPALGNAFGGFFPAAPISGGFFIGYDNSGSLGEAAVSRAGHYLVISSNAVGGPDGLAMSAQQAARLDRKLDDGVANNGTVFAGDAWCHDGAGVYAESNGAALCDLYLRIQN